MEVGREGIVLSCNLVLINPFITRHQVQFEQTHISTDFDTFVIRMILEFSYKFNGNPTETDYYNILLTKIRYKTM